VQLALANQFQDGLGTARDNGQASYWYKKAAEAGDMTAQYVADRQLCIRRFCRATLMIIPIAMPSVISAVPP
jgi:hypothetical protein